MLSNKPDSVAKFKKRTARQMEILNHRSDDAHVEAKLKAYHRVGREVLRILPEDSRAGYDERLRKQLGAAVNRPHSWIALVRMFAARYDENDLDELCALAPRVNWGHVAQLLPILDKRKRSVLQQEIARKQWTSYELRCVMRGRTKKQAPQGGPMFVPGDVEAALSLLRIESRRWVDRAELVMTKVEEAKKTKRVPELAQDTAGEINELVKAAKRVVRVLGVEE
jgi:hypothetical protein